MKDKNKKKDQLIEELNEARKRIAELEDSSFGHMQEVKVQQEGEEPLDLKLKTISSSNMDISSLELSAIMDVPAIQSLMDDFYKLTNMALAILDLKGKVLIALGWQDICTRYHRVHPQTALNCMESDLFLAKNMRQGEYVAYKCKNQLWDVVTPLYIGGKHVGNIYTGQFFYDDEDIDEEAFITQAERYGFDRESYLSALHHVPRFSRERVTAFMDFLTKFSVLVSDLSYSNLKLARTIKEQEQLAEALRSSEGRYRLLHDSMRDAVVSVDMEGHIKDYNESYLSMLGYKPEEISALTYQDITPEKWHAMESAIVRTQILPNGYSDIFEKEYRRKDGTVFPVELRAILQKDETGNPIGMWAIVRDITDRKRIDDSLRESERKYRNLYHYAQVGLFETSLKDATIIACNQRYCDLAGFPTVESALGRDVLHLYVNPEDREEVKDTLRGQGYITDHVLQLKNQLTGRIFWAEFSAHIDPSRDIAEGTIIDITERRQAEEALKETEERFRLAFSTSPDSININRLEDGLYVDINEGFTTLTGYTREDVIGKTSVDIDIWLNTEDRQQLVQGLRAKGSYENLEAQFRRKDGSIVTALMSARIIKLKGVSHIISITRDISERKQAEEGLRESEEKYRLITDNITDIILTTDTSGTYTFISSSHKRVLDRGEEVLGKSIFEHIHPEDIPGVMATFANAVKSRGIAKAEYRYLHPSRGYIWLESEGMLIDMHGSLTGVIVSRDITARKHADEALRESEEKFRLLFQSMVTGFALHEIICDEKGAPQDYRFLEVNPAFEQLTGLKSEDLVGRAVSEVLPDTEQYWIDLYGQVALTGNPIHFENFTGVLNKYFEVSAYSPRHGQFAAVFLDITARKRAEEELQKQHDLLTQLVGTSPVGITFVDASGKIIFANTQAEEILGLSKTDITRLEYNAPAWRITDLDGKPFPMENLPFMQVLKTRKPVKDIQHAIEWPDGRRILLSINGTPLISATKEFSGMVATFEDITERKKLEAERLKLEERLQQSYKMEAIGSLAGGIAHDFNNILSSVFGFAELAKMKLEDRANIENELDEILKAGIRARDLVKQILTFSRQAGIKREPMVVAPLIKETLKFIRASLPVTIEIRQEFPVSGSMIIADPTQIHQVIMNLCTNAAHAMKERGGMLDVRLAEVELDDEVEVDFKGLKRGRYLRLSVTDTGSGIPKEIIKRIFDPFFTTKERGEGTGMGLSVVHGIVKEMGGAISVYSDPGIGTTFNIILPLYKGEAVENKALDKLMKTGSGRILFVDDEEGVITSGRGILEQLGYEITSTTSPMEALELFTSDPGAFDLVLTDLTMPRMTGLELSERLQEIRPDIPIVLCTGFSLGISPERIRDAGIREMVMKPMVASELSEAVYKALNPAGG